MKKTIFNWIICPLFFFSTPLLAAVNSDETGETSFAVLSDIHVMCPALLIKDGAAFEHYLVNDRKLLKESPALMETAVEEILKAHPRFVLICGDLTKDGEAVSHHYVVDKYLVRFKQAGIRVYVIPGNHDVNNPHAVCFDGDSVKRVPTFTPDEFARCYADYGYGNAIAHDKVSLSYVSQLTDSIRLIAIDDCRYEDNDYKKDVCVTGGRIKPETLAFIKEQAREAHEKGYKVIAMMHHGLVSHWKWQDKAMPEYLVDHWKKQVKFFKKNNIRIIFTGHFHSQDIAERHGVYDVETGSTVTYPCPYRLITIGKNQMNIHSHRIEHIDCKLPDNESIQQFAFRFLRNEMPAMIVKMFPASLPDSCKMGAAKVVTDAYVANLAGDEHYTQQDKKEIKTAAKRLRHYSWKNAYIFSHLSKYLWNDQRPQDNECIIPFVK
ncbi:MAG: metallophosphoesterase [Bacteroidaceae bacterium]